MKLFSKEISDAVALNSTLDSLQARSSREKRAALARGIGKTMGIKVTEDQIKPILITLTKPRQKK